MNRTRLLQVLKLDFAILCTIIGSWLIFVLSSDRATFADLLREENLKRLVVLLVTWLVLYAQHFRVSGDLTPPDPPSAPAASPQQPLP